jgi:hypothetical protein
VSPAANNDTVFTAPFDAIVSTITLPLVPPVETVRTSPILYQDPAAVGAAATAVIPPVFLVIEVIPYASCPPNRIPPFLAVPKSK